MNNSELNNNSQILSAMKKEDLFLIPNNYFEQLNKNVESKLFIQKSQNFSIPDGYFESFSQSINQLILNEKTEGFKVPDGYFESLNTNISIEKSLNTKIIFNEPEGYFDDLPRIVQHKIYQENVKKKPEVYWSKPKLALAIITSCVVIFLGIKNLNFDAKKDSMASKNYKSIATQNTISFVQSNDGIKMKVSENTRIEIEEHLNSTELESIDESTLIDEIASVEQFEDKKDVDSKNEIQDFLIENNIDEMLLMDAVN